MSDADNRASDFPWLNKPHPRIQVRVRRTLTVPEFDFAYTDPTLDIDVSDKVEHNGGLELGITKVDSI